jgi:hypothetical protein
MSPPRLKPTQSDLECWRTLLARDADSPSGLCWRDRPRSLFKLESDWASWTAKWAWKPAGTCADGRWRVMVNERKFTAADIIAALEAMGDDTLRSDANAVDRGSGGTPADILADACRDEGVTLGDLTVLSTGNDPYRCATPDQVRNAQWAADRFAEVPAPHLRGFHYKLLGRVKKPNGATYSGSNKDWRWLKRAVAAARWRGLIPFDALEDRRAGHPHIHRAERDTTALEVGVNASFNAEPPTVDIFDGEEGELGLFPTIAGMHAEQPFLLAIFGEKSSLGVEVDPVAIELGADAYLETGEQSITHCYHLCRRAYQDGRHLVVGCITDCDPSGYQMAVSIARKIQALIDLEFPSLEVDVIHIGLTPAQVRHYRLPSSPLSRNELRRARWRERMGVEQTEIDALLARHPGELTKLIRKAFKPYYDPTLTRRVNAAEREWRAEAVTAIEYQNAEDEELTAMMAAVEEKASSVTTRIEDLNTRIERIRLAVDDINEEAEEIKTDIASVNNDLLAIAAQIDLEPPDIPEPELPDQPDDGPNMVLSSSWDWVEATERMKARKAYEEGDGDDASDDSEEEEDDE